MKTQKIKRSNLKEIYDSIDDSCTWKKKIQEAILWSDDSSITVEDSIIEEGYNVANSSQKLVIEKYFKINTPKKITERVKDFSDILEISGKKLKNILPWSVPTNKNQVSQNALAKIQLITEVYNEGVTLDWSNGNQGKYYPYFEKRSRAGWVLGSYAYWISVAHVASGCYYKSSELALDASKKFLDIYKEYLPE